MISKRRLASFVSEMVLRKALTVYIRKRVFETLLSHNRMISNNDNGNEEAAIMTLKMMIMMNMI